MIPSIGKIRIPKVPIDRSDSGTPHAPIRISPRVTGGQNCLCLTESMYWQVIRGFLHAPQGQPGSTNHAVAWIRVRHASIRGTDLVGSGSDILNFYDCIDVTGSELLFHGPLFYGTEKKSFGDIGRDAVFDGHLQGGSQNALHHTALRTMTVAAGSQHTLGPEFICDILQVGGGYGKDLSREPYITLLLRNATIRQELYIHPHVHAVYALDCKLPANTHGTPTNLHILKSGDPEPW